MKAKGVVDTQEKPMAVLPAGALRSPKPATAIPSATVEYTTRHPPDFEGDRGVGADDSIIVVPGTYSHFSL